MTDEMSSFMSLVNQVVVSDSCILFLSIEHKNNFIQRKVSDITNFLNLRVVDVVMTIARGEIYFISVNTF